MTRQTLALIGGAVVLFGIGAGASLGVVGNEESPAPPAATTDIHTMEGGMTMTGEMEEMPGMTMTGEEMPGMTMTGEMEEHGDEQMPGMTMTDEDEPPGMTMTEP